ncbi:unnamed protein product [Larinioides sclopetarius]|uniref:Uncharacterized protein n=1 Tax=Larinioides sclopetarius TaxID=280406 RepID=A0AAV2BGW4_9ARAC
MECSNPNTSFTKIRIIKNLAVISVSFLLIFTAYDGLSMLQTTMNKEEGVGTVAQTVLHISYGLSSLLLSSFVVMKLGTKNSQFLGMAMYLPYVAANFYASWVTLIPSAIIQGMGSTFLWAAQCTYFNECSTLYKELTDASTNFISRPKITYISDKEIVEELSALDLMNKAEGGQNPHRNCEKSLEISSTVCLSPGRYVRDNVPKSQPETNQRWSEKNKEHVEGFVESNSKWNSLFKSSATIKSIEITENNSFEIHKPNDVQNKHNKTSMTFSSTNALFFGLHGLAYCSAQVWSNLISFYVLSSGQVENYNKTSYCSCGADFCNNDEECVNTKIEEVPADVRYIYTGLCLACGIVAVLLIRLFVDPMVRSRGQVPLSWNHIFATMKFMKNKQQIFIIPLTICTCMLQAFYTADFTKLCMELSFKETKKRLFQVATLSVP